jgi:hypothetical protein
MHKHVFATAVGLNKSEALRRVEPLHCTCRQCSHSVLTTAQPYIDGGVEAVQDGRIHIEKINGPFLFEIEGTPGPVPGRPQARHRARVDRDARVRHLRPVHAGGREAICMKKPRTKPGLCMSSEADRISTSRRPHHRTCSLHRRARGLW